MYEEYYSRLGLPHGASKEDVKKAYRQLVKAVHPDVNPSPDAHKQFIALTEAYDALMSERPAEFKALDEYFNTPETNSSTRPDRKERYKRAMQDHQKIKNQKEIEKHKAMKVMVSVYNYIVPFLMVFAFIILLDVQMEVRKLNDTVRRVEFLNFEHPKTYRIDFYQNPSFYLPSNPGKSIVNVKVQIHQTAIFAMPIGILRQGNFEDDIFYTVRNNVIPVIRFLSFFIFILGILFLYVKRVSFRFNLFTYLFFACIILVVFLSYHGYH